MYIIGQIFGVIVSILSLIGPLYKHKWMMLINSAAVNLLAALNLVFIGQMGSAMFLNFFAVIQIGVSLFHLWKRTPVHIAEKIFFMAAFIGIGIYGMVSAPAFVPELNFENALQIFPIIGAVFFSISTFIKDEQTTRKWGIANCLTWIVYYGAVRSTSVFSMIIGITMNVIGLIKYRKKK